MASAVTQVFSSIGTEFGKAFGIGLNKDNKKFDSLVDTANKDPNLSSPYEEEANRFRQASDNNFIPRIFGAGDSQAMTDSAKNLETLNASEAKKVMAAKRNSTAGSASGRQGTMSGGSLLGGGDSSIGSKTLLGQ